MFAVNIAIRQFCLQLTTISCGLAVNSSYRDIIDYPDNVQGILQNIVIANVFLVSAQAYLLRMYACTFHWGLVC